MPFEVEIFLFLVPLDEEVFWFSKPHLQVLFLVEKEHACASFCPNVPGFLFS